MSGMKPTATRRQVIAGLTGAAAAICCGDHASAIVPDDGPNPPPDRASTLARSELEAVTVADGLRIHPRSTWGDDLPPRSAMNAETVRFLLVHHTASDFGASNPRAAIRSVYSFHTGPQKRWPDVAYNFFVAPDGSVWEGRAGSLDGPVEASATGGNQGFSQLVCLIGNHVATPPTPAAQSSLVRILAWLAGRHDLGVHKDASTTFVSRGSNKFRAGETITTPVISPHRAVTFTACPGDAAIALLPEWRRRVFDTLSATWTTEGIQRARRRGLERP